MHGVRSTLKSLVYQAAIAFKKKIFCPGALKPPGPILSAGCTTTEFPPVHWHTSAARARLLLSVLQREGSTGDVSRLFSLFSRAFRSACHPVSSLATGRPQAVRSAGRRRLWSRRWCDTAPHPESG